MPLVSIENKSF